MSDRLKSFDAFWPYYLGEHKLPLTRAFHFVGTTGVFACLISAIALRNGWYAAAAPFSGYGFAWASHFFIEKNRPATFTYPLWSLAADFKMYFLILGGKLGAHLQSAGIAPQP